MERGTNFEKKNLFAAVSKTWEALIDCKERYRARANIMIDEQLLAFWEQCGFWMHMSNKSAKVGLQITIICDS